MELTSGLSKRYKKAFVVDEDGIRRIQAVLEKAAKDLPDTPAVVFHVERDDDRYYETTDISDVLADPNISGKRITMLGIGLRRPAKPEPQYRPDRDDVAQVTFRAADDDRPFPFRNRVSVRITTDDKNWALLLADELQPQVERTFRAKASPRWVLALFALPFVVAIGKLVFLKASLTSELWVNVIMLPIAIGFLFYAMSRLMGPPQWFSKIFGPESVFLWGEEGQAYPEREQTRRNVFWGVVVAFLVTFAASIVFAVTVKAVPKQNAGESPTNTSTATNQPALRTD